MKMENSYLSSLKHDYMVSDMSNEGIAELEAENERLKNFNFELKRQLEETNRLLEKISNYHHSFVKKIPWRLVSSIHFLAKIKNSFKRLFKFDYYRQLLKILKKDGLFFFIIDSYKPIKIFGFKYYLKSLLNRVKGEVDYQSWIHKNENLNSLTHEKIKNDLVSFSLKPKISFFFFEESGVGEFLKNLTQQTYENWELIVVNNKSKTRTNSLKVKYFDYDEDHFGELLKKIEGEYFVIVNKDMILFKECLYSFIKSHQKFSKILFAYGDHDSLDKLGEREGPNFKPDWNLELLYAQNYIGDFVFFRTECAIQVGAPRMYLDGAVNYDLMLRLYDTYLESLPIVHIPCILHHLKKLTLTPQMIEHREVGRIQNERWALNDSLKKQEPLSSVEDIIFENKKNIIHKIKRKIIDEEKVEIIICTRDKYELLHPCVESILNKTHYQNYLITIVDNRSEEDQTIQYLKKMRDEKRVRVIEHHKPFNFSELNNVAVKSSDADIVILLNNDTEVISSDWLDLIVSHLQRPGVAIVGAKLLYPDNTLQHAGVLLGCGERVTPVAGHYFPRLPDSEPGYCYRAKSSQFISAVTGAALAIRRNLYLELGGLDEVNLKVAFNDIDLCLKAREKNLKVLWSPDIVLYHKESQSRGYEDSPAKRKRFYEEATFMRKKWGSLLDNDPYYNPNLNLTCWDFTPDYSPRTDWIWQQ